MIKTKAEAESSICSFLAEMAKNTIVASQPNSRLAGKVAIITGGASGIGASTVETFHENGAKVVIADIKDDIGRAMLEKLGHDVWYFHCDVRNEDEISNLIDKTIAKYGKLDIMFNSAGIKISQIGSILDSTKSELERLISVNLGGAFLGAKHAVRVMIPRRKGCILFTSINSTEIGSGLCSTHSHSYAVTSNAIVGLTKNLAAEIGQHGIRVNCISPSGLVKNLSDDPITEVGGNLKEQQIVKAEDVAKAALYLASDDANYVSAVNLVVDGAYCLHNPALTRAFNPIQ